MDLREKESIVKTINDFLYQEKGNKITEYNITGLINRMFDDIKKIEAEKPQEKEGD